MLARGRTHAAIARFALVAAMVLAVGTCETIQYKAFADDALDLARILVAEGGRVSTTDHIAILHVLDNRRASSVSLRHRHLIHIGRRYSVTFNGNSRNPERAARMRSLSPEEIPASVRSLVRRWEMGQRPPNPCPGAMHWAAPYVRSPLPRVACTSATVNAFYLGPTR